ncbi:MULTISPECIES: hypothetical protein [unclassified Crossiella]|uniref:hypothetical protein n=1 Tax=unclassified Crossiella TaxID=2620835 RepID=UPI00207CDA28|nr:MULTISPECIES: hypothetical protein [unclassified Crossiella]MCO1582739.1 hypothetical protein [Crossiella sp. SN42]WHT21177.1 hypothetical protein N8J89_08990 [Crossiella sp. CA-258035]
MVEQNGQSPRAAGDQATRTSPVHRAPSPMLLAEAARARKERAQAEAQRREHQS